MAQATVLASGTTEATSSDIVVAAGAVVTVGLFVSTGVIDGTMRAKLYMDTPGVDNVEAELDNVHKTYVISGPCTARVVRKQCPTAFGVYTES